MFFCFVFFFFLMMMFILILVCDKCSNLYSLFRKMCVIRVQLGSFGIFCLLASFEIQTHSTVIVHGIFVVWNYKKDDIIWKENEIRLPKVCLKLSIDHRTSNIYKIFWTESSFTCVECRSSSLFILMMVCTAVLNDFINTEFVDY